MKYLTMSDAIKHITDHFFLSGRQRIGALCIVHATQSNCCGTLDFLSLEPCPQQPQALITRFRESYSSVSMSLESKRLKKSRSDWLNSGSTLIQHLSEKNAIFVFPRFAR